MTEVSRSVSKLSVGGGNVLGSKHMYDDVFSSPPIRKSSSSSFASPFAVNDYADIFAPARDSHLSAIPILDLPDFDRGSSFSSLDYSGIFGGGGEAEASTSEKKSRCLAGHTIKMDCSQFRNSSYASHLQSKVSSSVSSDSVKNVNVSYHKSNTMNGEWMKGGSFIAEVHAVPGFASVIDEVGPSRKKLSVDSVQVNTEDGDISLEFSVGKKQRKHSKKVAPHVPTVEKPIENDSCPERGDVGSAFGPSFDKSRNIFEARSKAEPCDPMPMPDYPQYADAGDDLKRSSTSSFKDCEMATGDSSPTFSILGEQLDLNSDAAVCAAAVKRAIEEAEAQIRLAKVLSESGHGFKKMTLKDHLKLKAINDDKHVSHANGLKGNDVDEHTPEENMSAVYSELIGENAHEPEQAAIDSRDPVEVFKDVETDKKIIADDMKSAQESRSCEGGGEWEAAKQLSQLFTGVKNRLASFMAWQGDGDRNATQTQAAATNESLEQSYNCREPEEATKLSEEKDTDGEQDPVSQESVGENDAHKMASAPEVSHQDLNDLTANVLQRETIYRGFNAWPDAKVDTELIDTLEAEEGAKGIEDRGSCSQDYEETPELMFYIAKRSMTLEEPLTDHAECMSEFEEHQATDSIAINAYFNEVHRDYVPDYAITDSYGCGHSMKEIEKGERKMHEVVHEHEVNFERNAAYSVQTGQVEEGAVDRYKLEDIDGIDKQGDQGVAEEQKNSTKSCLVEEIGEGGEEVKDVESRNMVNETYFVVESIGEDRIEDSPMQLENLDVGGETNPRVVLELKENRKLLNQDNLVGEISADDSNKTEDNEDSKENDQEAGGEEQEVTCMQDEGPLLDEAWESDSVEYALKWDEHEKTEGDVQYTDVIYWSDDANILTEEIGEAIMQEEEQPVADDNSRQEGTEFFSRNEAHQQDKSKQIDIEEDNPRMEETRSSSRSGMSNGESVSVQMSEARTEVLITSISCEDVMDSDRINETNDSCEDVPDEEIRLQKIETDKSIGSEPADVKVEELASDSNAENDIDILVNEYKESPNVSDLNAVIDGEREKHSVDATHRRRRWFEGMKKAGTAPQPSLLAGDGAAIKTDKKTGVTIKLDDIVGTEVEDLMTKSREDINMEKAGASADLASDKANDQVKGRENLETTHKRRRWFEDREEGGVSEQSGIPREDGISMDTDNEIARGHIFRHNLETADDSVNSSRECSDTKAADTSTVEPAHTHRRKRWFENEELEPDKQHVILEDSEAKSELDQDTVSDQSRFAQSKPGDSSGGKETKDADDHAKAGSGLHRDINEAKKRQREKDRERLAVERAMREARERKLAEVRERAALERPTGEVRQKVAGATQEGPAKASTEAKSISDKASTEAKQRAERAAVERATAEARVRALQKVMSEKSSCKSREPGEKNAADKVSSLDPNTQSSSTTSSSSFSGSSNSVPLAAERTEGTCGESAQRSKARQERNNRTMERAAKALEEKNKRDLQAQKELAEKHRCADVLDAEVKRWSAGKEGNLRALLSELQYILGPDSGWQPTPLTDLVTSVAVRKAYKKATLCVHPDKLQQRRATIQQKYICEKVFDLLKEAWQSSAQTSDRTGAL